MRYLNYMLLLCFVLCVFSGCDREETVSEDSLIERKDFVLTRSEMDFIRQNNGFALEFFKEVSELDKGASTVISPLSVTIDFGMVNNGAVGETKDEIDKALGYENGSTEGLNAFSQTMLKQSAGVDPSTSIEIGNAAVINKSHVSLKESFTESIKNFYDAEIIYKEFGKDDVMGLINSWCDKKTHGMIPRLLESQPLPYEYAHFLNAVYFKGIWSKRFKKSDSKKEDFTLADGNRKQVKMMWQRDKFNYGSLPGICQTLCLPYGNQAYRMIILLPYEGKTLADIKESLDLDSWSTMVGQMRGSEVDVKIPVFETTTPLLHLVKPLKNLGIVKAFSIDDADFSGMADENLYIGDVLHKARIKVDEQGSEAAAVTDITMYTTSASPQSVQPPIIEFHADHPFIYAITEISSGAIFFIGQYTGK